MSCEQFLNSEILGGVCRLMDALEPVAVAKELFWPVLVAVGGLAAALVRAFYKRRLVQFDALNGVLKERLNKQALAHGKALDEERQLTNEFARKSDLLSSQVSMLSQRAPGAVLEKAMTHWRLGDFQTANQLASEWMRWEGESISRLLLIKAEWASSAMGEYRSSSLAAAELFAGAAIAFRPDDAGTIAFRADLAELLSQYVSVPPLEQALRLARDDEVRSNENSELLATARAARLEGLRLRDSGLLHLAVPMLQWAAQGLKAGLGQDHLETLLCQLAVCDNQIAIGAFSEARAPLESVVARMVELAPESADTGFARHVLAKLLFKMGELGGAYTAVKRAITLLSRLLGADHPDVAICEITFFQCLRLMGRNEEVAAGAPRTLKCLVEQPGFGLSNHNTLVCAQTLALALAELGRASEALAAVHDCMSARMRDRTLANHPDTLVAREVHTFLLSEAGKYEAALAEIEDIVLQMTVHPAFGPGHRETLIARGQLARLQARCGRHAEAAEGMRGVIEYCEGDLRFASQHRDAMSFRHAYAEILLIGGDAPQALTIIDDVVHKRSQTGLQPRELQKSRALREEIFRALAGQG